MSSKKRNNIATLNSFFGTEMKKKKVMQEEKEIWSIRCIKLASKSMNINYLQIRTPFRFPDLATTMKYISANMKGLPIFLNVLNYFDCNIFSCFPAN